jgi:hypothetical protein
MSEDRRSFRRFGVCTFGRNWGDVGQPGCEAKATHERRGFPERLACEYHAFDEARSTPGDPNWLPLHKDVL